MNRMPPATAPLASLRERRSVKWTRYPNDVLPAWVAEMDFDLAEPISVELRQAVERGDTGYADADGSTLADDLAGFAARRMGWGIDPDQVTAVRDVVSGIAGLLDALTEPGDGVIINPPVYYPFFSVVREVGRELVEVGLDPDGRLDVPGIEAAFAGGARALILCSPHNPTGTVHTEAELRAIGAAALEYGAWVISDEIHAPLAPAGAGHVPFLTLGAEAERAVTLISASKAFNLAGLGCAQIVTGSEAGREGVGRLGSLAEHPGHLGVLASAVAFSSCEEWLDAAIEAIDANAMLLEELLGERLPAVGYSAPATGFLAWLDFSATDLGHDPAPALLERGRVALSPGLQFGSGGGAHARLNIGTSPELVSKAVERIAGALGR